MANDGLIELERLAEAGYRPNSKAMTSSGAEVTIMSFPFSDGRTVGILARTRADDPTTWQEFDVHDLVIRDERTPGC